LTDDIPKCLLPVYGKPLLLNIIDQFRAHQINDISVIRGYKKDKITFHGLTYYDNDDFMDNNILHSLMHARPKLEESLKRNTDVVITYSDIWYNDLVVSELLRSRHKIAAVCDIEWRGYYRSRTDHPESEAEKVILRNSRILQIGKHLAIKDVPAGRHAEFIGLWKMTPVGTDCFLRNFNRVNKNLSKQDKFQHAVEWQKAYVTDMFQELVDKGHAVHCVAIRQNWKEFDTVQDYERLERQKEVDI
jgi:choline kinase